MKFIKFGLPDSDNSPTLYPTNKIESITLFDTVHDLEDEWGEFKIVMWLVGQEQGISESYDYNDKSEIEQAQLDVRARFDRILEDLNA